MKPSRSRKLRTLAGIFALMTLASVWSAWKGLSLIHESSAGMTEVGRSGMALGEKQYLAKNGGPVTPEEELKTLNAYKDHISGVQIKLLWASLYLAASSATSIGCIWAAFALSAGAVRNAQLSEREDPED